MKKAILLLLAIMLIPSVFGLGNTMNFILSAGNVTLNNTILSGTKISCNDVNVDSGDACNPGSGVGGGGFSQLDNIYLYNNSGVITLNETKLNATIAAESVSASDTNETTRVNRITSTNCSGQVVAGFYSNGTGFCETDDTGASTDTVWDISTSLYLYNNSGILEVNETKLNATIDNRDSDTTYTNGTGISLVGTTFSIVLSYFQGIFIELTDSFGGEVSGTYDNLVLDNDALDDQYYELTDKVGNTTAEIQVIKVNNATHSDTCSAFTETDPTVNQALIEGFGFNITTDLLTYFTGIYIELTDNFGGDVSGTYDSITITDDSHNHIIGNVDNLAGSSQCTGTDKVTNVTITASGLTILCDTDVSTAGNDTFVLNVTGDSGTGVILNNEVFSIVGGGSTTTAMSGNTLTVTSTGGSQDLSDFWNMTAGNLGWANLTSYPSACTTSQTLTTLADTLTCSEISITESQISDLSHTVDTTIANETIRVDLIINTYIPNNISNHQTAFKHGNTTAEIQVVKVNNATHSDTCSAYTETDPTVNQALIEGFGFNITTDLKSYFDGLYYLQTQIDTQGEMETIWGITIATDSEVTASNSSMKAYVDIQDHTDHGDGANCAAGNYPLGVDENGAAQSCTADQDTTYTNTSFDLSQIPVTANINMTNNNITDMYSWSSGNGLIYNNGSHWIMD